MFAIETQVPHISRWMMLFNVVSADALASTCSGTSTDATLPMMTSSNGNIFRITGPLCGEFTGPGEFPTQRPVMRSFDVFFDMRLNKRLSKQPWGWWFETPSWSLWRHCNAGQTMHILSVWFHETNIILYDTTISIGPYQNLSLHLVFVSFCYSHQTSSLYFIKCFIFYVWYVYQFFFFCSESSYFLWRGTMYFLSCTSIVWNRGNQFDPRLVHDNLSVPLWVYMRFPVPEHQNWTNKYVYRQRQGAV